jgi:hypothetical protein
MKKSSNARFSATKNYLVYAFVIIFVMAQEILFACPNCKEGFDKGTEQAAAGAAYSLTICFLLLVPITMIGVIVWKVRKQIQIHATKQVSVPTATATVSRVVSTTNEKFQQPILS